MQNPSNQLTQNAPLLLPIPKVCEMTALSRATVYKLIQDRKLIAVKVQGRTLVRLEELRTFVDGLPAARGANT